MIQTLERLERILKQEGLHFQPVEQTAKLTTASKTPLYEELLSNLEPQLPFDLIQYDLLPYVSSLDAIFDIQVHPLSAYQAHRRSELDIETTYTDLMPDVQNKTFDSCWAATLSAYMEYDRQQNARRTQRRNETRNESRERYCTFEIGMYISIKPKKSNQTIAQTSDRDLLDTIAKEYYKEIFISHSSARYYTNFWIYTPVFGLKSFISSPDGWNVFLPTGLEREFNALKQSKLKLSLNQCFTYNQSVTLDETWLYVS